MVPSHSGANWTALTTRIRQAYQPFQVGSLCPHLKLYMSNDEVSIVTTPRLPPLQILMTMRLPSPSKHLQTSCGTENQSLDSSRKIDGFNGRLSFKSKPVTFQVFHAEDKNRNRCDRLACVSEILAKCCLKSTPYFSNLPDFKAEHHLRQDD